MRSCVLAVVLLTVPLCAVRAADAVPARKLHKVVIVNLAWDTARAAQVEAGIKTDLVKKGVTAAGIRTLTLGDKKPATVQELVAMMQAQGYESLLCIGARKTMQITPTDKANDFPTMDSCLSIFLTGAYPSGMSLRSEPFVVEVQPTQRPQAGANYGTSRTPMGSAPGAAPVTYYKRTIRLFDVSQQTLFWEKKIMVKMPAELNESLQTTWIAHQTLKTLEQAGLLP